MAAVELGCDYTGIELDPNYVAISNRRIQAWWDKCNPNPFGNPLFSEGDEDGPDEKDSEDGDIR
jgi:hypothetical protein